MILEILDISPLIPKKYEISLIALLAIMVGGWIMHLMYLKRIEVKVRKTAGSEFKTRELKNSLRLPQGSNFNTLVLAAWSLFFVDLAFLYILTPQISPNWNYLGFAQVASSDFGLAILGVGVILVSGLLAFNIPRIYRYYLIPRGLKRSMVYMTPLLLVISLYLSSYLGTIFPQGDYSLGNTAYLTPWNLAYVTLFAALILLILPVVAGFMEGSK